MGRFIHFTFCFWGTRCGGNRTRLAYADAGYKTYEYEQLNRLRYVKNPSGAALASYTYDSRSRRTGLKRLHHIADRRLRIKMPKSTRLDH